MEKDLQHKPNSLYSHKTHLKLNSREEIIAGIKMMNEASRKYGGKKIKQKDADLEKLSEEKLLKCHKILWDDL